LLGDLDLGTVPVGAFDGDEAHSDKPGKFDAADSRRAAMCVLALRSLFLAR
jgi:hypothetical protein